MRITRLQKKLKENRLKGAVISDADDIFYLSGHLIREGCGPSLLFVPVTGEPVLVVPEDDINLPSCENFSGRVLSYTVANPSNRSTASAAEALVRSYERLIKPTLGIEANSLPYSAAKILGFDSGYHYFEIGSLIREFRAIKDRSEIELMKFAAGTADAGQAKAKEVYKEGEDEIGLQAACRAAMESHAGLPIECKADVLFGENTALIGGPAGAAGRKQAEKNGPAIVDLLPRVRGYFADTTRTLWAGSPPSEKKQVVELLTDVKRELERMLRPGAEVRAIDEAARKRLSETGSFPHHTGHGIGISSFEAPFITPDSRDVLEEGMTLTLEPGLYFDTWGARIEDDYIVTGDGFVRLSCFPED